MIYRVWIVPSVLCLGLGSPCGGQTLSGAHLRKATMYKDRRRMQYQIHQHFESFGVEEASRLQ